MFVKRKNAKVVIFHLFVDDIVVNVNNGNESNKLKIFLTTEFETKDRGLPKYFLIIEVVRSKNGIVILQ